MGQPTALLKHTPRRRRTRPEPQTVGELVQHGAARFKAMRLKFGHGTTNARDEAAYLALYALKLPLAQLEPHLDLRPTPRQIANVLMLFERRIEQRFGGHRLLSFKDAGTSVGTSLRRFALTALAGFASNEVVFVDALLDDFIDPRGLEFGGWANGGFVSKTERGNVTEEDRAALIDWLSKRPEVEAVMMSGPLDAWYTDFVRDDELPQVFSR